MKFKQRCFIRKNTDELKEYLEKLGYEIVPLAEDSVLECHGDQVFSWDYSGSGIDCGVNEDLFKALAAINDETDYMQWFVSRNRVDDDGKQQPDKWVLCDQPDIEQFGRMYISPNTYLKKSAIFHKASAEELIKQFGTKDQQIYNDVCLTSRSVYLDVEGTRMYNFLLSYAEIDEEGTVTVPMFRVLDALNQHGNNYCQG